MEVKSRSIKAFKPTQEERAFIYQKASELKIPVIVILNQNKKKYEVTFIIDPGHSNLEVKAEGASIVDACMRVKKKAQKKMSLIPRNSNQDDDLERDYLIELMKNHVKLH